MTNVVSIFTKMKKNEPGRERASAAPVHVDDMRSAVSPEGLHEAEVEPSLSEDKASDDVKTKAKFNDIERANAERLKKIEEQRKKDNQLVLKSYRIK